MSDTTPSAPVIFAFATFTIVMIIAMTIWLIHRMGQLRAALLEIIANTRDGKRIDPFRDADIAAKALGIDRDRLHRDADAAFPTVIHLKTGTPYVRIGVAKDCTNAREGTFQVIYALPDGGGPFLFVRDKVEFDEKFRRDEALATIGPNLPVPPLG
jgi:hypothetical protein